MGIGTIVGMASVTVASVFLEDYLNNAGKPEHAKKVAMATSAGVSITVITIFITFVKALKSLG